MTDDVERYLEENRLHARLAKVKNNAFITPAKTIYNAVVYILNILNPSMLLSCPLEKSNEGE